MWLKACPRGHTTCLCDAVIVKEDSCHQLRAKFRGFFASCYTGQRKRGETSVDPGMQLSRAINMPHYIGGELLHKKSGSADTMGGLSQNAALKIKSNGATEPPTTADATDTADLLSLPPTQGHSKNALRAGRLRLIVLECFSNYLSRFGRVPPPQTPKDVGVCASPAVEGGAMTAMLTPGGLMMIMIPDPLGSPFRLPSPRERAIEKKERHASQLRMKAEALREKLRTRNYAHASAATGRPLRRMFIKEYDDFFISTNSADIDAGAAQSEGAGVQGRLEGVAGCSQPEAQHDCKWMGKPPCVDNIDVFKRKPGAYAAATYISADSLRLPCILPLRTHEGGYPIAI